MCALNTVISLVTSTGGVRKEGKEQNTPYTLINMCFTPELTVVCKHININVVLNPMRNNVTNFTSENNLLTFRLNAPDVIRAKVNEV